MADGYYTISASPTATNISIADGHHIGIADGYRIGIADSSISASPTACLLFVGVRACVRECVRATMSSLPMLELLFESALPNVTVPLISTF